MTKLCSACGTENREEAQFCRACGTAFAAQAPRRTADPSGNVSSDEGASAANVCPECGFQNKPGLRYCANCGMSLAPAFAPTSPPLTGASSMSTSFAESRSATERAVLGEIVEQST
jgi:hypothetical protein